MQGKDATLYIQTFAPFFKQAFLDQSKKLTKFIEGLEKTLSDIIFIQEPNENLIAALTKNRGYHIEISPDKDTLICLKKNSFSSITSFSHTEFTKEEI